MAKHQRDPAKESLWRKRLARFASSELSVREFCKREDVTESAFYAWRRTIGERDGAGNPEPAFVPAVINGEAEHDQPHVLVPAGGMKLHFPSATPAEQVAELYVPCSRNQNHDRRRYSKRVGVGGDHVGRHAEVVRWTGGIGAFVSRA